jgi:DNA-binding IclR family transcriptional regulator
VLEREQFILHDKVSRRFSLGSYLYVLGSRAAVQVDLLRAALPHLRGASNLTGLTCNLSQRATDTELVYIAKEEPSSGIHIDVNVGERFPIVAGSHGKCHLAYMPPPEAEELIARMGLPAFTRRTITNPERYLVELGNVRRRGYATSFEEWVPGVNGVSVPIMGHGGIVSAMSASGTSAVVTPDRIQDIAQQLVAAARNISHEIRATYSARPNHEEST